MRYTLNFNIKPITKPINLISFPTIDLYNLTKESTQPDIYIIFSPQPANYHSLSILNSYPSINGKQIN